MHPEFGRVDFLSTLDQAAPGLRLTGFCAEVPRLTLVISVDNEPKTTDMRHGLQHMLMKLLPGACQPQRKVLERGLRLRHLLATYILSVWCVAYDCTGADSFTSVLLTPNKPHPDMDPTAKPELSAGPSRSLHQPFDAHSAQFIYFTSGSTGKPKGVVISGESVTNNAKFLGYRKGISGGLDVGAVTQPFSHVGGLVVNMLSQMMHGVTNVLPAPSFDPRATLAAVQEEVRPKLAPKHNDCGMLRPCARTVLHEAPPSFEVTYIHLCVVPCSRALFWMAFPVNSQSTSTSQNYSDMTLLHSARVPLVLQPFLRS
jgi:hypothetical protein